MAYKVGKVESDSATVYMDNGSISGKLSDDTFTITGLKKEDKLCTRGSTYQVWNGGTYQKAVTKICESVTEKSSNRYDVVFS